MTTIAWTPPGGSMVTLFDNGIGTLPQSGARLALADHTQTGLPPAAVQWAPRLLLPGAGFVAARHLQRTLSLHATLVADSWTQHQQGLAELGQLLSPVNGPGTLTWTRDDGVQRTLTGLWTALDGTVSAQTQLATPLALTFTSTNPYWQWLQAQTVSIGGVGAGWVFPGPFPVTFQTSQPSVGTTYTLQNPGTAPTAPVITLNGPMTSPRIDHLTSGRFVAVLGTIPAGGSFTIDMRPDSSGWFMQAYGTTYQNYPPLDPASQMFDLAPGANVMIVTNTAPGAGGTGTIWFLPQDVSF